MNAGTQDSTNASESVINPVLVLKSDNDAVKSNINETRPESEHSYILKTGAYEITQVYNELAHLNEKRGDLAEAINLWKRSSVFSDAKSHSLALVAMLKAPGYTNAELLREHQQWASQYVRPEPEISKETFCPYKSDRPLNIGYHCTFWDSYTMKRQFLPVLGCHDRKKVIVHAYSPIPVSSTISSVFDQFTLVDPLCDRQFIEKIRSDKIDILIELNGYNPGHRFKAMASRCAPIQVSYLNHLSTTGVPNIDYVLADEVSAPLGIDQYFTEKIYRLPGSFCFFLFDDIKQPDTASPPAKRNGYATFGCFGTGSKINREIMRLWAQILHKDTSARLFIRNPELDLHHNKQQVRDFFVSQGVDLDRLKILGGTDPAGIKESYKEVDVTLDTHPHSGINCIAESMSQGVPVITLEGTRFSSRCGASVLQASGCSEFVANSEDGYVNKAVSLGNDLNRLTHYRQNLHEMIVKNGFGDASSFARKLESAYRKMIAGTNSSED